MDPHKTAEGFQVSEIVEKSFEGVVITDNAPSGIIQYVNKAWEKATGWSKEEVVGKLSPNILKSGKQPQEFYKRLWDTILAGKLFQGEIVNKRKDGSLYTAEINVFPIISASGAAWYAEISRDITEKVKTRTEQALRLEQRTQELSDSDKAKLNLFEDLSEERDKLIEIKAEDEAILLSIGDGLMATDRTGKITFVNSTFERLLGWNESEVTGKTISEVVHITDESGREVPEPERPIMRILKGETTAITTTTNRSYRRRDGTLIPVAITAAPILAGPLFNIVGAVVVFRDITKERELDRVKSEFISVASHQLRTPLTGIQWVVERFTKKEKLTSKGKEYLDDIHVSAKHLTQLVDLLLNLSRIDSGKVEITLESLEVIGFVRSYLNECAPICEKKGLKLVFKDHPPKLVVTTDKTALRNIVQGFVSNAIEYTPSGGTVEVVIEKGNNTFVIQVRDTGIGIPSSEQSNIFEKFVRATNAKLYKTDGTGIGLYIVKQAANLLGGKAWFGSEENKGSTFYVELPLESRPQKDGKAFAETSRGDHEKNGDKGT
jgi:PAS domain S-box-containing protein